MMKYKTYVGKILDFKDKENNSVGFQAKRLNHLPKKENQVRIRLILNQRTKELHFQETEGSVIRVF